MLGRQVSNQSHRSVVGLSATSSPILVKAAEGSRAFRVADVARFFASAEVPESGVPVLDAEADEDDDADVDADDDPAPGDGLSEDPHPDTPDTPMTPTTS